MKKRGFRLETRGQVTVFIILGIVLLLAVGTVIFITSQREAEILEPGVIPALKTIPSEFDPIRDYVQSCMETIAIAGFKQLGERGGYINTDDIGLISLSEFPTESDAVQFSPNSDLKVAYWWYLKAPNGCQGNCLFSSMRPDLSGGSDSVEKQIDNYIQEQLPICLNNFAIFEEQGFLVEVKGDINPETTIANEDIAILLEYALEVSRGGVTSEVSDFFIRIPLNFKQIYDFATLITESEGKYNFLEKHTNTMISVYSDIDEDKLPPTGSTEIFSSEVRWSEIQTKGKIEDLLMMYIPFLQIYNSRNYVRRLTTGGSNAIYEMMELPINLEGEFDELSVSFVYLKWWPIYFDVNSRGDLIGAETIGNPLLPLNFVINRYVTAYDISYPVIVEVSDPTALFGEGYTLRFALETNIRNNKAIDERFEGFEGVKVFEKSLFCNYNQRNSGNITIDAKNAVNTEMLEDIQVRYSCGADSCVIGATDSEGRLEANFPICYNGILSFDSSDYFAPAQTLTTSLNKAKHILVNFYPYIDKEIRVKKYLFSSRFNQLAVNPINIKSEERAMLSLTKIKDNVFEQDVSTFGEYKGNDTTITLRLVPGRYSANINMFLEQRVYIPEETRKIDVGLFGKLAGAEEEYVIPAIEFNESYPIGGAIFNAKTGLLVIDADNLYGNNIMEIYVVGHDIPTKIEDVELIGKVEEQTARFRSSLEPGYIR